MWTVFEHRDVSKDVRTIPKQVRQKYEFWKSIVRTSGPDALRMLPGFHDEALAGKWNGFRSSRLNARYRVIYRVDRQAVAVAVERVSAHDYR